MTKLLIRFWPILLPIVLYLMWRMAHRRKKEVNEEMTALEAKVWVWTLAASLIIAIATIVVMFVTTEPNADSTYVPAHMEDGVVVPGKIVPKN